MKKMLLVSILVLSVLMLAACATKAGQELSRAPSMIMGDALESDMSSAGYEGMPESIVAPESKSYSGNAATIERIVIRSAQLSIVVEDPGQSAKQISQMADQLGGYVISSNVYKTTYGPSDVPITRGSITIRVPAEHLDEAIEQIKSYAIEIESENVSGQDVTEQYTDLTSRLRNLEAAEEQLREIMASATKTEDVLRVFDDLRQVREQIEVIKGQMQYIEQSASLSQISVDLIPDEISQPLQIGGWRPEGTAKRALQSLIQALQWIADVGIWLVICVLPVALILGLPAYFVIRAIVRRRRAKKEEKPASE